MARFRLILEYDGSGFHGWQFQEGARTVEGCLRKALRRLSQDPIDTAGASRTDTGVHALGQCALVEIDTELAAPELGLALQALTPDDMAVRECLDVDDDFHPRFSAIEKCYLYRIFNGPRAPVFGVNHQWWLREPLDVSRMHAAAQALAGEHDFVAFRNRSKDAPEHTVRHLRAVDWRRHGDHVVFQVIGNRFLYRMVRNLVGTLTEVGRGHWRPSRVAEVLESRDRREAGPTAPPQGLFLMAISYPDTSPCELQGHPPLF